MLSDERSEGSKEPFARQAISDLLLCQASKLDFLQLWGAFDSARVRHSGLALRSG
jgi:hypothetical protein